MRPTADQNAAIVLGVLSERLCLRCYHQRARDFYIQRKWRAISDPFPCLRFALFILTLTHLNSCIHTEMKVCRFTALHVCEHMFVIGPMYRCSV